MLYKLSGTYPSAPLSRLLLALAPCCPGGHAGLFLGLSGTQVCEGAGWPGGSAVWPVLLCSLLQTSVLVLSPHSVLQPAESRQLGPHIWGGGKEGGRRGLCV